MPLCFQLPELSQFTVGLMHIQLLHTSASLAINENWDPDVRADMEMMLNRIVPEDVPFRHSCEGPDDMVRQKRHISGPFLLYLYDIRKKAFKPPAFLSPVKISSRVPRTTYGTTTIVHISDDELSRRNPFLKADSLLPFLSLITFPFPLPLRLRIEDA